MLFSVCQNAFLLEVCVPQTSVDHDGSRPNDKVGLWCTRRQRMGHKTGG